MVRLNQEEGRYRVLLIGIGDNTEEQKDSFCHDISKNYSIPFPLLKKIVDRCPIILKKNLPLKKAEILAKTLKSFGAAVSVEERRNVPPITLEFQELVPHQLALESSYLRKTRGGTWSVIGRAKNISDETLNDTWVLIQLFENLEEFITFEEAPLPINPLPSGETSPFKVIFAGDLSIKKISVAFKNASGQPIPAVDKRKKREWAEVEIEGEHFFSPARMVNEFEERSQTTDVVELREEMIMEKEKEIPGMTGLVLEEEVMPFSREEKRQEQGGSLESISDESLSLILEPSEEVLEPSSSLFKKNESQEGEGSERACGYETFREFTPSESEEVEEEMEEEAGLDELEPPSDGEGTGERLGVSVFEEATQLLEDISGGPEEVESEERTEGKGERIEKREEEVAKGETEEGEELPSFSWIEYFRNAVENHYEKLRDIFSIWFEECRKEGEFKNSLHALLTLLVHSRFDQGDQSIKALENTQRVFRLIVQPNLLLNEIPLLEGTPFVSGEDWRDLFHRALPKVHQIGNAILEKNAWNAFDLEQLIRVIPHMGHPNSRMAIRWINELISDIVEVDFSNAPVTIGEGLYRVASRLGIVDPHFDYYQGRNSMGGIKIQSFAKMAFPQNPVKVEEPMDWIGREEERGGHCFPIQPRCEGCLFETFCPRLYVHFNPSEKGIRG